MNEIREIIGNTTATPNPRPNWNQNDSTKADYIINKPELGALASKDKVSKDDLASDVQDYFDNIETSTKVPHIRYSAHADGKDFTEIWRPSLTYIGFAVAEEAPTNKEGYQWSLFASNVRHIDTIQLLEDGWSNGEYEISISGIGANSSVFCTPHPDSNDLYIDAGVMLYSATTSSLLFKCLSDPAGDVIVNVQIVDPLIDCEGTQSWNDLEDKPFYDNSKYIDNIIEWDASEKDISVVMDDVTYYHISDATPKFEDMVGVECTDYIGKTITITDTNLYRYTPDILVVTIDGQVMMAVIYKDNYTFAEMTFQKAGIYARRMQNLIYPITLTSPNEGFFDYDIKKIDEKYLPNHVVVVSTEESSVMDLSQYPVGTLFILYENSKTL